MPESCEAWANSRVLYEPCTMSMNVVAHSDRRCTSALEPARLLTGQMETVGVVEDVTEARGMETCVAKK